MTGNDLPPGAILTGSEPVEINPGLTTTTISITNTGEVPVQLTAHFHVFEANPRLSFDRLKAFGMRLDVPSGGAVRIEPGESVIVNLVPIGGARVVRGFNGLVDGSLDQIDPEQALAEAIRRGFLHQPE